MTDRELLGFAAKALGGRLVWSGDQCFLFDSDECTSGVWRPLDDDGDALRLAVRLQIQITPGTYKKNEFTAFKPAGGEAHEHRSFQHDSCAATRRAIVRAAAEIGRSQP